MATRFLHLLPQIEQAIDEGLSVEAATLVVAHRERVPTRNLARLLCAARRKLGTNAVSFEDTEALTEAHRAVGARSLSVADAYNACATGASIEDVQEAADGFGRAWAYLTA